MELHGFAWWAASLMPNDSEETAKVLDSAGRWLMARDSQVAEPCYQALVIRCGDTMLGREAARQRWFPKAVTADDADTSK